MTTTTVEVTVALGHLVALEGAMIFEYGVGGQVLAQVMTNFDRSVWTAFALDFRFYVDGAHMKTSRIMTRGSSEEEAHHLATMWALSATAF